MLITIFSALFVFLVVRPFRHLRRVCRLRRSRLRILILPIAFLLGALLAILNPSHGFATVDPLPLETAADRTWGRLEIRTLMNAGSADSLGSMRSDQRISASISVPSSGLRPLATPAAYRYYLPLFPKMLEPGPHTVEIPVAATWRLFATGNSYADALAGAGLIIDGPGYSYTEIGQFHTHFDQYYVVKAYLAFDTDVIPAAASILSATLVISRCLNTSADEPFKTVELYRAAITDTVTTADWNAYDGPMIGSFGIDACANQGPVEIPLDVASVQPDGMTRYALITDQIRLGIEPAREHGDVVQIDTLNPPTRLRVDFTTE